MKRLFLLVILIITTNLSAQWEPSIIHSTEGNYMITWEGSSNNYYFSQHFSIDGTPTGANIQFCPSNICFLNKVISLGRYGKIVLAQSFDSRVDCKLYSSEGLPIKEFVVDRKTEGTFMQDEVIRHSASGNFLVAYTKFNINGSDIYARLYSHDGNPLGTCFAVNDSIFTGEEPVIATNNIGDFLIVWRSNNVDNDENKGVFARLFSNDGTPKGDNFRLCYDCKITGYSICSSTNGNFLLMRSSLEGLVMGKIGNHFATLISKDGAVIGDEVRINPVDETNYSNYTLSTDDNDNFLITWSESESDTTVHAQRYSSESGLPIGEEFIAANLHIEDIYSPPSHYSRSIDKLGNLIFIWSDKVSYYEWGMYFQRWSLTTGNPLEDPIRIDTINVTSIEETVFSSEPHEYRISQNYPNPFNPATKIQYSIPVVAALSQTPSLGEGAVEGRLVTLTVYNILGREVATLVNEQQLPGNYEVEWDATNQPSGVYFYKILAGEFIDTKKMLLIK